MLTKGLEDYQVEPFEYAHLVETAHMDDRTFKFHIPKLMAGITKGSPQKVPMTFNNNLFLNAADCKPATSNKVTTQNYVTVRRHNSRNFVAGTENGGEYIKSGTKFIIHTMYGNIKDMRVSDVI